MKKTSRKLSIFDYFDYREYLDACYHDISSKRRGFSYRAFSREAGIKSHNFLPRIIKRARNCSEEFVPLLSAYLKLSPKETQYFKTLIAFNKEKKPSVKEKHLKQLLTLRLVTEEYRIQDEKLRFFEKWYYPVIRELATICNFQDDYAVLARACVPRISAIQAEGAVAFLLAHGFIRRGQDGRYSVNNSVVATDPEVDSAIIPKYHKATLRQCIDAIETVKKEDRNFSSSTLLVSKNLYEEMKKEIFHFRKRLLSMAKDCQDPEMVCFAGFQLLPRSRPMNRNPKKNS